MTEDSGKILRPYAVKFSNKKEQHKSSQIFIPSSATIMLSNKKRKKNSINHHKYLFQKDNSNSTFSGGTKGYKKTKQKNDRNGQEISRKFLYG